MVIFFFFKQKTAYEMRISDWSSDVCSSDLFEAPYGPMGVNSGYALIAQRHMAEYATTSRQLAKIAVDQRTNACANPDALYREPITIEQVLESPLELGRASCRERVCPYV